MKIHKNKRFKFGKHQSNQINIYTTDAIRKISKIDSLQTQYRSTNDSRDLYSVKDISNSDLSASDLGIDLSVYNEIERQFLEESVFDVVDGKIVSKRNKIFDKNEKDGNNKSNLERMQEGNAPLCKDGMSMELHHLKQEDDGIIIELTSTEHKKYYKKRAKELENETA